MDIWTDNFFQPWRFANQHTDFIIIISFQLQDKLNITLSQEDQQGQAQTYIPSRKINFQHSRYSGFQGNCLRTDNKLGEDVVFLNVEN